MGIAPPSRQDAAYAVASRWAPVGVALLCLLVAAEALPTLGIHLPNPDEGIDYRIATTPDAREAAAAIRGNAHPPLYYGLLRVVAAWLPDGAPEQQLFWLRLPSLLAGLGALLALFAFARRAADAPTAFLAVALVAASPAFREQLQLLRPYALSLFLLWLGLWLLARTLDRGSRVSALGLALVWSLAAAVHYASFVVFAAAGVTLGIGLLRRHFERRGTLFALAALLPVAATACFELFSHILPRLSGGALQRQAREEWLAPFFPTLGGLPDAVFYLFAYGFGLAASLAALLLFVLGSAHALREEKPMIASLPLLALGFAMGLGVLGQYPFGGSRHNLYLLPLLALPIAYSIVSALRAGPRRSLALAGAVAIAVLASVPLDAALDPAAPRAYFRPPEQLTPYREHPEIASQLARWRESPGFVVMPRTSYLTLLPVLRAEIRGLRHDRALRFWSFAWGERRVFVHEGWELHASPAMRERDDHLAQVLARIARSPEGRDIARAREVALVFSGWATPVVHDLLERETRRAMGAPRFRDLVQAPGYTGFVFEVSGLVAHDETAAGSSSGYSR